VLEDRVLLTIDERATRREMRALAADIARRQREHR